MDVGLNNRNTLGEIVPELGDIVFLVEANSNERLNLWQEWSVESQTNIKPLSETDMDLLRLALKDTPSMFQMVSQLNDKIKNEYHHRVKWEEISKGLMISIGNIKIEEEMFPVNIVFSFSIINGKKVCFYDCCSRIVDHTMVENWLIERFQLTHDSYTRWNHVDAANFHNCINSLDNIDKEPRDTKYAV